MSKHLTTDNGILGPTFLDGLTEQITNPLNLHDHEWRRRLRSERGNNKFLIKYYGNLLGDKDKLITATDFSQPLLFAVDAETGEEILLFDGCKHGYNALLCDTFTNGQITDRKPDNIYRDKCGNEIFDIVISTYNGIDFDDELLDDVDQNGTIQLADGSYLPIEVLKRNGYDTLQIWGINKDGQSIQIVSEELA